MIFVKMKNRQNKLDELCADKKNKLVTILTTYPKSP